MRRKKSTLPGQVSEGKIMETVHRSVAARGEAEGAVAYCERWVDEAQKIFRAMKILCMSIMQNYKTSRKWH